VAGWAPPQLFSGECLWECSLLCWVQETPQSSSWSHEPETLQLGSCAWWLAPLLVITSRGYSLGTTI
jgi:hypothetical protein